MSAEDSVKEHFKSLATIAAVRQLSRLCYSRDGEVLLGAGRDGLIYRWRLPAGGFSSADAGAAMEQPSVSGHNGWVVALDVSPDGSLLLSADSWGRLTCRSMESVDLPVLWNHAEAHAGWIRQAVFTPAGKQIVSCGLDGMVRVWSVVDGKLEREFSGGGEDLYSLACDPHGETVVVGDLKGAIHRYGLRDGARVQSFDAGEFYKLSYIQDVGGVRTLAFSADGAVLAAGGCIPENGGFVQGIPGLRLFSTADGTLLQALRLGDNQDGFLHQVMAHPGGYWMGVCSGQPGKGKVFLHRQGEEVPFCLNKEVLANCHSLALHPGGKEIAVAANAGTYGQQKSMAREGNYPGNTSPIHVLGMKGEE